jgi:hypothetical protein
MNQYEDIYIEFNFETLSEKSSSLLNELGFVDKGYPQFD